MLEPAQGNKYIFLIDFLFGHIIKILLTELGRSVWENLDLGRWYRPHCVRSVLATSVKILPYRPPARLIRTKTIADMCATLDKQLRAENLKTISSLNGIVIYDLCDTGALLYQLS